MEFKTGTPPTEPSEPTDELKLVSTSPASDATVTEDDSLVLTFNQELSKNLNWTKGSIYIKNYNTERDGTENRFREILCAGWHRERKNTDSSGCVCWFADQENIM